MHASQRNTIPDEKLVGYYYFGDGMGDSNHLQLQKTHRFIRYLSGCGGEYNRIKGAWQQKNGFLILTPDSAYNPIESEINLRFIPVPWGKQIYLIDENEMPGFCAGIHHKDYWLYTINSRRDYATSNYLSSKRPTRQGKPSVPDRYQDFLENGEIQATVLAIDPRGDVLLKENGSHRLKPGMRLCLSDSRDAPDITVTQVNGSDISARQLASIDKKKEQIRAGHIFTTGSHWNRPEGTWGEAFMQERR